MKVEIQRLMDFYCRAALTLSGINPPFSKESKGINNWAEHEGQLKRAYHVTYLWKVNGSFIAIDLRWTRHKKEAN